MTTITTPDNTITVTYDAASNPLTIGDTDSSVQHEQTFERPWQAGYCGQSTSTEKVADNPFDTCV
ncbi:MAG: hypothetical protein IH978_09580 [Nitrospinae bacterium]|nr:hypothetical protein [Nitrospinota bacterium]